MEKDLTEGIRPWVERKTFRGILPNSSRILSSPLGLGCSHNPSVSDLRNKTALGASERSRESLSGLRPVGRKGPWVFSPGDAVPQPKDRTSPWTGAPALPPGASYSGHCLSDGLLCRPKLPSVRDVSWQGASRIKPFPRHCPAGAHQADQASPRLSTANCEELLNQNKFLHLQKNSLLIL